MQSAKITKQDRRLICLTPIRNEEWILATFLKGAIAWADRIILADQQSTDRSQEICRASARTTLLENPYARYDEGARQRLLLSKAREVDGGGDVLLALDADEILSANAISSPEWELLCTAPPGTVLRFRWINLLPGLEQCWIPPERIAFGFVDDGSTHDGSAIHSRRLPWPTNAPVFDFDDIVVLHCQYLAWERMRSKQRWYQVWEHLENPRKRPIQLFRQYNHMLGWKRREMHPVKPEWVRFGSDGPDLRKLHGEEVPWWDLEVLRLLKEHGPETFRKLDIWDRDWRELGAGQSASWNGSNLRDPRTPLDCAIHRFLRRSQSVSGWWSIRGVQHVLRLAGW